ncbi:Uncharacterized protein DAT39_005810, partial [Clarias magur]
VVTAHDDVNHSQRNRHRAQRRCFCVCGCCTSVAGQFSLLPGSDSLALLRSSSHYRRQIRLVLPSGLPHFQRNSPP